MSSKKHKTRPTTGRSPKLILSHSADRRNIVGIPAEQNPKYKKFNRRPTAR